MQHILHREEILDMVAKGLHGKRTVAKQLIIALGFGGSPGEHEGL